MKRSKIVILTIAILLAFAVTTLGFTPIAVKSIKLNAASVKISVGKTYGLKVTFTPANATNKKVTFSSADKSIATVSSTGYIKGIKAGKTVITVTSASNKKAVAKCNVTISQLNPVSLTWCIPNSDQKDLNAVLAELNKVTKKNLNVNFKFNIYGWGEYDQKMQIQIAAGEVFDLSFTSLQWVNKYVQNVAKGAFVEMGSLLDKYAPTLKKSIPQKYWDQAKIGGKIYAAPNYQIIATSKPIQVKKDLADKYGFDITKIKKLEDLEPFMENIVKNEKGVYPLQVDKINWVPAFDINDNAPLEDLVAGFIGVKEEGGTFKTFNAFAADKMMKHLKLMRKWQQKGYIRKDAISITDSSPDLNAGKYALFTGGTYKPGGLTELKNQLGYECDWKPLTKPVVATGAAMAAATAISITSKNPERAMMLMDLVASDKSFFNTMIFGIENKHYKKLNEDTVDIIPDSGYLLYAWELGNQFNSYYTKGQEPGTWEATVKFNEEAEPSPLAKLKLVFDQGPVKAEIAQLQTIYNEYVPALFTGSVDPEASIPELLEKIKGPYEKVEAELINQINKALGK